MPSRRRRNARAAAAPRADAAAVKTPSSITNRRPAIPDAELSKKVVAATTAAATESNGDPTTFYRTFADWLTADMERGRKETGEAWRSPEMKNFWQTMAIAAEGQFAGNIPSPSTCSAISKKGVVSAVDEEIKTRGEIGTGATGPGVADPGAKQKPRHRSRNTGAEALEQKHSSIGTLEHDLGGRIRKPKPRNAGYIDEKVWSGAKEAARGQVKQEYCIPGCLDAYHTKMCQPGKLLLADEVHRRTQAVYDYRVGKIVYRENRKKT